MIRVLIATDMLDDSSGVSSVIMNYYRHFRDERLTYDFLVFDEPEEAYREELARRGSDIFVTGTPSLANISEYIRKIRAFLRENASCYDIVHVHNPNSAFAVLGEAKRAGIPVRILHAHNSRGADGSVKKIRNALLNRWGRTYAGVRFACSPEAASYLFGKKAFDRGEVTIIPNAIETDRYRFDPEKRAKYRETLDAPDAVVIGHVGRFVEQKNHLRLLELFREAWQRNSHLRLLLVGDGPLESAVRARAEELGIKSYVLFAGKVPDVWNYMQMMDVFVLPSLYEGLPVVGLEAQAAGLPCIFSDVVSRDVQRKDSVAFVANSDTEAWVSEVERMSGLERGRDPSLRGYDIENAALALENRYIQLWKEYRC